MNFELCMVFTAILTWIILLKQPFHKFNLMCARVEHCEVPIVLVVHHILLLFLAVAMFMQSQVYLSEEILCLEMDESLERINMTSTTCNSFKNCFEFYKDKIHSYCGPDGKCVPDWSFKSQLVFGRIDIFLQRLSILTVRPSITNVLFCILLP